MALLPSFMDFGTTASIVRFGASFRAQNNLTAVATVFKSIFLLRSGIGLALVVVGIAGSSLAATWLFHDPTKAWLLIWTLLGAFIMSFVLFIQALLQTNEEFTPYSVLTCLDGLGKLAAIGVLVYALKASTTAIVSVYLIIPVFLLIIGYRLVRWDFIRAATDFSVLSALFSFSKFMMIANICYLIYSNLDVLMLTAMHSTTLAGIYGSAFKIAAIIQIITTSLATVMLPRAAMMISKQQLTRFLKQSALALVGFVALLAQGLWFARTVILAVAGPDYEASIPVFKVLYLDNLVTLLLVPVLLLIFTINKPWIYAFVSLIELVLNIVGNLIFIPRYGAFGAALVTLIVRVVTGALALELARRAFGSIMDEDLRRLAKPVG